MPPRPPIPDDDLYARLGVPVDASVEAIDVAWRGLLRRHHPDVAGETGLEASKRINVAHDWLADPGLRARYDEARFVRRRGGAAVDGGVASTWSEGGAGRPPWAGGPTGTRGHVRPRRPATPAERVAALLERIDRLTADDLDRLALAEPAPIAFLATLARFVPPDLQAQLDAAERAAIRALPRAARERPAIGDAVIGRVVEPLLADVLDELLGDPAGEWARERLTRGWDAAVGQPRYGPATQAVRDLLTRLAGLDADELRWLAQTGQRDRLGDAPWPDATSRDEDEALRVSSELAADDAARAVADAGGAAGARRAAARIAHLLVLRHAFTAAAFDRHAQPWSGTLVAPSVVGSDPRVRFRRG